MSSTAPLALEEPGGVLPETPAAPPAHAVVHNVGTRMRTRVPRVRHDAPYVRRLQALADAAPAVAGVRINPAAASVVVHWAHSLDVEAASIQLAGLLARAAAPAAAEPSSPV